MFTSTLIFLITETFSKAGTKVLLFSFPFVKLLLLQEL